MKMIETITSTGERVTHAYTYCFFDWKYCPTISHGETAVDWVAELLEDFHAQIRIYRIDSGYAEKCYLLTTNTNLTPEDANRIYEMLVADDDDDFQQEITENGANLPVPQDLTASLTLLD